MPAKAENVELTDAERDQIWQESLAEARALLADKPKLTPGQQAEQDLEDRTLLLAPDAPLSIEDLRSAIRGAKDPQDLEARLAVLLDEQTPEFGELLALAGFCADVLGYVNAKENRA
jgi:hypothetical protein